MMMRVLLGGLGFDKGGRLDMSKVKEGLFLDLEDVDDVELDRESCEDSE